MEFDEQQVLSVIPNRVPQVIQSSVRCDMRFMNKPYHNALAVVTQHYIAIFSFTEKGLQPIHVEHLLSIKKAYHTKKYKTTEKVEFKLSSYLDKEKNKVTVAICLSGDVEEFTRIVYRNVNLCTAAAPRAGRRLRAYKCSS